VASEYASATKSGGVSPAYLSLRNPLEHDQSTSHRGNADLISAAKAGGHDGVIIRNAYDGVRNDGRSPKTDVYVAFHPEQIKSATGNTGAFDPANPDIRFASRAPIRPIPPQTAGSAQPPARPVAVPNPPPKPGALQIKDSWLDRFRIQVQDKFLRLKRTQEAFKAHGLKTPSKGDVYGAAESFQNRTADKVERINKEYTDPIVKALGDAKLSLSELADYMYAKHVPHRNQLIQSGKDPANASGSGWTDAKATQVLADFRQKGLDAKLEPIAQKVRDALDHKLQMLVDSGIITAQKKADLQSTWGKDYVPLKHQETEELLGIGSGFQTKSTGMKEALGRHTEAENPVVWALGDTLAATVRAERNIVGNALRELAVANPNNGVLTVNKKHPPIRKQATWYTVTGPKGGKVYEGWSKRDAKMATRSGKGRTMSSVPKIKKVRNLAEEAKDFVTYHNGQPVRITIEDAQLKTAMEKLHPDQQNAALQALGSATRAYTWLVTSGSPEFLATNFARDIQTMNIGLSAEKGKGIAVAATKKVPSAIAAMNRHLKDPKNATGPLAQYAREFTEHGGAAGVYGFERDMSKFEENLHREVSLAEKGIGGTVSYDLGGQKIPVPRAAVKLGRFLGEHIERWNMSVENGTRLAAFAALREAGASAKDAARYARDMNVNFSRKGQLSPTIGAMYAFANANVQGSVRVAKLLDPRTTSGKTLLGGLFALGVMQDQMNAGIAEDENNDGANDWSAMPDYVKDKNLVFFGGPKPVTIPMPHGFNLPVVIGRLASAVARGDIKAGDAASSMAGAFAAAFNPIGGESDPVQQAMPTLLDPVAQHVTNKNFAGNPLRPEQPQFGPKKPDSELAFKTVNPLANKFAKGLNKLTGGDHLTPGMIDISPETIEHVLGFLGGGTGRFITEGVETVGRAASGDFDLRKTPFLRRAAYEPHPSETNIRYRDAMEEAETLTARRKAYEKERNFSSLRSLPQNMVRASQRMDAIDKQIQSLRKMQRARPNDAGITRKIESLQKDALRVYEAAKRAPKTRPI
jgi:hypothetical protein